MPIFSSGYPTNSSPADADVMLTSDASDSDAIKGVTLSTLATYVRSKLVAVSSWVSTSMLQDGSVTSDKIDFTTFELGEAIRTTTFTTTAVGMFARQMVMHHSMRLDMYILVQYR